MQDIIGQMVDVRAGQALINQIEPGDRLEAQALSARHDLRDDCFFAQCLASGKFRGRAR